MTATSSPYILIAEDEPSLARLVADYLMASGMEADIVSDGLQIVPSVQRRAPDLLVLDLMLPGCDGLTACRALRAFSDVPILMLTARVEEVDRLIGLEAGADDYVCKPFSPREVVARVKAILRRRQPFAVPAAMSANTASRTGLQIDTERMLAQVHGQPLELTPLEFRLLRTLAEAPGRVFSRNQLLDRLHDDQRDLSDRAIDSHIKNLRRKLEQVLPGQEPIRSIYGVGYRFEPPDAGVPASG